MLVTSNNLGRRICSRINFGRVLSLSTVKMSSSGSKTSVSSSIPDLVSSTTTVDLDHISKNIEKVRGRITLAIAERSEEVKNSSPSEVRLVAVGKLKPASHILKAYNAGHRHFGENYVQELVTKAEALEKECPDIKWHFIGHLQSNKIGKLISVGAQLSVIETVDSQRIAGTINSQREKWIESNSERRGSGPLDVMVQVNTSGENAKGGVSPSHVNDLVGYIVRDCPFIRFRGLMTIGRDYETPTTPNPDFVLLVKIRESLCRIFKWEAKDVELSMGMSGDFEEAIRLGSSNVRVGSTIFGERNHSND